MDGLWLILFYSFKCVDHPRIVGVVDVLDFVAHPVIEVLLALMAACFDAGPNKLRVCHTDSFKIKITAMTKAMAAAMSGHLEVVPVYPLALLRLVYQAFRFSCIFAML